MKYYIKYSKNKDIDNVIVGEGAAYVISIKDSKREHINPNKLYDRFYVKKTYNLFIAKKINLYFKKDYPYYKTKIYIER